MIFIAYPIMVIWWALFIILFCVVLVLDLLGDVMIACRDAMVRLRLWCERYI